MMARWLGTTMVVALVFSSGCCCMPCGPCGPARACCFCLPCLPKPIVWHGACNECGPCPGESCANYGGGCGPFCCGLFPWLRGCWSCGRGCSEVYVNEWISDPPDCCDPCDQCYGQFTGPRGYCCLGPAQRVLAAIHGYKYCPGPNCGPWRPIFGCCNPCGPVCGGCGGAGCASCGGAPAHGADVYYQGPVSTKGVPVPPAETSILEENWDAPRVKPEPGKPIHNAQQPMRGQMSYRAPQQLTPSQVAGRKVAQQRAAQERAAIGAGVRSANYEP
jgi:hypothetical protein